MAGSVSVTSASSPVDRPAGSVSIATRARRSSVMLSLVASTRATLPDRRALGFERSTIEAGSPSTRPAERPWSSRTLIHKDVGSMSRSTACPATTVDPDFGLAADHHAIGGCQQAHVVTLLSQARALGRQALGVLARGGQVRVGAAKAASAEACSCCFASTAPALMNFCGTQFDIATRRDASQLAAGLSVAPLRLRRGDGAAGACDRGVQGRGALVEVHRVHLGQQLPGLDRVADIDQHLADAAGGGRPDQVGTARLDRADAEQRRRQAADGGLGHRHANRRQGAGAHDHIDQRHDQHHAQQTQAEPAPQVRGDLHGAARMPRR